MNTRIPLLHLSLGRCYEIQQNLEDALAAYRAERKIDPANTQLSMVIGRVLLRMQRYEQALEELRRADQASDSGALNFMIGSAYQGLGRDKNTKRYLAEAQRLSGSLEAAAREALLITGQKVTSADN